jgi:hypothetical protein
MNCIVMEAYNGRTVLAALTGSAQLRAIVNSKHKFVLKQQSSRNDA